MESYGLVADIGGTNVRFAMVDLAGSAHALLSVQRVSTKDHADLAAAARAYLAASDVVGSPEALVFAVAGPVADGEAHLTNAGWDISARALGKTLGVSLARVVNDFEALAEAVPVFEPADLLPIGAAPAFEPKAMGTIALVGPGTGLGVGGLLRTVQAKAALASEGGHVAFAPADETEMEILRILAGKFGRVSMERILSGPGLLNLHGAMCDIAGVEPRDTTPEQITATAHTDPASFEAKVFARFAAILGSFAGDVALCLGARQGLLVAGGILPDVADLFAASPFRARFEDKGRFADYMKAIPTCLIVAEHAGLIGAAAILRQQLARA